jgi:hypothetical protein
VNILERIDTLLAGLQGKGLTNGDVATALKKLIHSRAVGLLVTLSPNKADDAVLELLKGLFPAS